MFKRNHSLRNAKAVAKVIIVFHKLKFEMKTLHYKDRRYVKVNALNWNKNVNVECLSTIFQIPGNLLVKFLDFNISGPMTRHSKKSHES